MSGTQQPDDIPWGVVLQGLPKDMALLMKQQMDTALARLHELESQLKTASARLTDSWGVRY